METRNKREELLDNITIISSAIKNIESEKEKRNVQYIWFEGVDRIKIGYPEKINENNGDSDDHSGALLIDHICLNSPYLCDIYFEAEDSKESCRFKEQSLFIFNDDILEQVYSKMKEKFWEMYHK